MNRYLRGALAALGGAFFGFFVANIVVYQLLGIQPGDRTDLLVLVVIVGLFAGVFFWLGWRR